MATKTARQRREEARAEYDVFMAFCPSRQVLDSISDKWVALVVCALESDSKRYSELSTAIAGVSQKMLTQTLRSLERDGLVRRTVTPSVPVRVDYELTSLGLTLVPVIRAIRVWSESHIDEITAAREAFDGDRQPAVASSR